MLFAENLAASPIHKIMRKKFIPWGKSWRYVTLYELNIMLQQFPEVEYKTAGFFGAFGRNNVQRDILGKIDILTDWLIPNAWRYIVMCIASKKNNNNVDN